MKKEAIQALLTEHAAALSPEQQEALCAALSEETSRQEDRRATEATKSAVANYERKHGLRDGKPTDPTPQPQPTDPQPQPTDPTDQGDTVPQWARGLMDELKQLKDERTAQTRRQALDALLEPLPSHLRAAYSRTPIDTLSEEDFTALTTTIGEEVKDTIAALKTQGVVFKPRTVDTQDTPTGTAATEAELAAVLKASPSLGKL